MFCIFRERYSVEEFSSLTTWKVNYYKNLTNSLFTHIIRYTFYKNWLMVIMPQKLLGFIFAFVFDSHFPNRRNWSINVNTKSLYIYTQKQTHIFLAVTHTYYIVLCVSLSVSLYISIYIYLFCICIPSIYLYTTSYW